MKPGREYEALSRKAFSRLFPDCEVVQNDRILGVQSGIRREIDVSIRGRIGDVEFLLIVQAKDHSKPADIKIIGEFSSVIKDVQASKGFFVCSSGFAKTIHSYARSLGIELLSIEDIESNKWKPENHFPVIYGDQRWGFEIEFSISVTEELAKFGRQNAITIEHSPLTEISIDGGIVLILFRVTSRTGRLL